MVLAQNGSTTLFEIVLVLHLLAVIVGFGSTFVWPVLAAKARQAEPGTAYSMSTASLELSKILTTPVIWVAGALGVLLIPLSSGRFEFSDPWISIAFALFIVSALFAAFVHNPNLKAMNELQRQLVEGEAEPTGNGPPAQVAELTERGKRAGMYGGLLHLLFALMLLDMVFKPF